MKIRPLPFVIQTIFFCLLISTFVSSALAQKPGGRGRIPYSQRPGIGSISGEVIDSLGNSPIPFVRVEIYLATKDSLVDGALTDEDGKFYLSEIRPGIHSLKIITMGFEEKTIKKVFIRPDSPKINLGKISLSPSAALLEGVEIQTQREYMIRKIDKKVYNPELDLSSRGGNATDILKNIPSIEVDIDGNVSFRGSSNLNVLINGKPSSLTGSARSAYLEQLPASSIEKIELITNPSAKYDPDGMAGILNIVIKRKKKPGINGGVQLGLASWNKYNFGGNLNFRNKSFAINSSYNFNHRPNWRRKELTRETTLVPEGEVLNQYGDGTRTRQSHLINLGVDWYISDKISLSATGDLSPQKRYYSGFNQYYFETSAMDFLNASRINSDEIDDNLSYNYSFTLEKAFEKEDQKVVLNFNDGRGNEYENGENEEYLTDSAGSIISEILESNEIQEKNKNRTTSFQLDYSHPLSEIFKMESGYKGVIRTINTNYKFLDIDPLSGLSTENLNISNHFQYREELHGWYGTLGAAYKKLSFQTGIRLEQAFTTSHLISTNEIFKNNYFSFFPSAHISYDLDKKTDVFGSYSRRINRPSVRALNPFISFADPLNIRKGNPFLLPEYVSSIEVGASRKIKKLRAETSLYYKYVSNVMRRYISLDTNGIYMVTYQNFESAKNFGIEASVGGMISPKAMLNIGGNFYRTVINASNLEAELNSSGMGLRFNGMLNYSVNKRLSFQLSGMYRAPEVFPGGRRKAMGWVNFGGKYSFFNQKATIAVNLNDLLNTRRFGYSSYGETFTSEGAFRRESRILSVNFSWFFGKPNIQRKRGKNRGGGSGGDGDFGI